MSVARAWLVPLTLHIWDGMLLLLLFKVFVSLKVKTSTWLTKCLGGTSGEHAAHLAPRPWLSDADFGPLASRIERESFLLFLLPS